MAKDASQYLKFWKEGSNVVVSNCLGRFGVPLPASPRPGSQEADILSTSPSYVSFVCSLSVGMCVSVFLFVQFYQIVSTKPFCVWVPANSLHSCPFTPFLHTLGVTGTGSLV